MSRYFMNNFEAIVMYEKYGEYPTKIPFVNNESFDACLMKITFKKSLLGVKTMVGSLGLLNSSKNDADQLCNVFKFP